MTIIKEFWNITGASGKKGARAAAAAAAAAGPGVEKDASAAAAAAGDGGTGAEQPAHVPGSQAGDILVLIRDGLTWAEVEGWATTDVLTPAELAGAESVAIDVFPENERPSRIVNLYLPPPVTKK